VENLPTSGKPYGDGFELAGHESGQPDESYEPYLDQMLDDIRGRKYEDADRTLTGAFLNVERAKREWEATVDALPELICVVDEDGLLVRANRTVESWSLGPVHKVRGQEIHEFLHPHCEGPCYLEGFLSRARAKALTGQPAEHEAYDTILRRHLHVRILPVRGQKREVKRHVAIIVHDITGRKEMEQALQRNNERLSVLNALNRAVLKAQTPEEIAQAVLKHVRPLVPFQQAYVLSHEPDRKAFDLLAAAVDEEIWSGKGVTFATDALGKNASRMLGEPFLVSDLRRQEVLSAFEAQLLQRGSESFMSVPLQSDKAAAGAFLVGMRTFDDFTAEQIQIVREVGELLTIAIRQTRLYRKLTRTNRELQEVLRLRHASLIGAKGELAPSKVQLGGSGHVASDEIFGPMTAEQIVAMNDLRREGDQLYFMVNGLFRLRNIVDTNLEKEGVALDALVEEEFHSWEVPAANHEVELNLKVVSQVPLISADPKRLRQVISILLDNALSNSGPRARIDGQVWQEEGWLMLAISDQGAAIEPEELDGMLARYHRVRDGTPDIALRLGLGLALCESIVVAHGGRIWAERGENGEGVRFRMALPLSSETDT
jgi:PAS domain S-box-containing protein